MPPLLVCWHWLLSLSLIRQRGQSSSSLGGYCECKQDLAEASHPWNWLCPAWTSSLGCFGRHSVWLRKALCTPRGWQMCIRMYVLWEVTSIVKQPHIGMGCFSGPRSAGEGSGAHVGAAQTWQFPGGKGRCVCRLPLPLGTPTLPWEPGPILTFYPDLFQLCHLSDGLLQVFHELLHLVGAQGAEVQHLLLLRAREWGCQSDAMGVIWNPATPPPVSSHSREARAARYREHQCFGKLPSSRPRDSHSFSKR